MGRNTITGETPRNRQKDILNVAIQLFSDKGIEHTSLDDIAHAVGVTKPTIYHYFKNKEAICTSIFDQVAFNATQVKRVMDEHKDLESKLNAVAFQYLKIMKTPPSLGGIIVQRAFSSMSTDADPVRKLFVKHLDSRVSVISRALIEAEPSIKKKDARLLISQMMHSLTSYWMTEHFLMRQVPTDKEAIDYAERAVATTVLAARELAKHITR